MTRTGPPSARRWRRCALGAAALAVLVCCLPFRPGPDQATRPDGDGSCTYPAPQIPGTPWALRRLDTGRLWRAGRGAGVRVAVIDTGVDDRNPQLRTAVDARAGVDLIVPGGDGTDDDAGHGTEVAGIIAARPAPGTGFVGIAPRATVIPVRQNDAHAQGTVAGLATAVRRATDAGAQVINISQDTASPPTAALADAVDYALAHDIVVVASAGNSGSGGARNTTYPAAYPGVLAVGASDRAGQRADFSQEGPFVGVLAPGVDMVSTVPGGGQCVDDGTSFSAPYVAGLAALLRGDHPDWTARQVVARIEQTARRPGPGRTDALGWGVVDPVAAVTDAAPPRDAPAPAAPPAAAADQVSAAAVTYDHGAHRTAVREASYVLVGVVLTLVLLAGGATASRRDTRRR